MGAQLVMVVEEYPCPLRDFLKESCKNLVGLVIRMKDRCWRDHWELATGEKIEQNPHIPKPEPVEENEEKKEEDKDEVKEEKVTEDKPEKVTEENPENVQEDDAAKREDEASEKKDEEKKESSENKVKINKYPDIHYPQTRVQSVDE